MSLGFTHKADTSDTSDDCAFQELYIGMNFTVQNALGSRYGF